jgi:hypothetical protein
MKHEKSSFTLHVLIHVIKHDMDPNSNVNYCRKIGPLANQDDTYDYVLIAFQSGFSQVLLCTECFRFPCRLGFASKTETHW